MSKLKNKLTQEIYTLLAKGYEWLYHQAIDKGHWGDIRSTALSSIAIELREPINSKWLQCSKNWLLNEQANINDTYYYWNEEVWDTAMQGKRMKKVFPFMWVNFSRITINMA